MDAEILPRNRRERHITGRLQVLSEASAAVAAALSAPGLSQRNLIVCMTPISIMAIRVSAGSRRAAQFQQNV